MEMDLLSGRTKTSKNMEENKRMRDLVKKLDAKHETYKKDESEPLEEAVLKRYSDRFKTMILQRESNQGYAPSTNPIMGVGRTVNSITDNGFQSKIASYDNFSSNASLTPSEAFEIAIKRTLESGGPINNVGFYDEINWVLQNMGFDAKLPLDIKNAINDMLKYGNIKNS